MLLAALVAFSALSPIRSSPTQCSGSCTMTYYGGHVIPNVKVYVVEWGSGVDTSITSQLPAFYSAATNSVWMDWLSEYDTPSQNIGRGTFAGKYTITPSVTGTSITDAQISAELDAQITAGHLPPPDQHTIYMTYFAHGVVIDDGTGSKSCASNGFCAYHSTFVHGSQNTYYGVVPDFGAGSGCDVGCGGGDQFQNVCSASSHELIEAVTDADVGLVTGSSLSGLGWYNSTNGEVGDMCNQLFGSVGNFTVQKIYSSALDQCITSKSGVVGPSASPNTASVAAGGHVTIAVTPGAGGTLTVATPTGVTGSFSGNTLTLSASASAAAAQDQVVVITETSSGAVHTTSVLLQITAASTTPGFTVAITPSSQTVTSGNTIDYTVTTAATGGFTAPIDLAVSGLPADLTGSFASSSVSPGESTTLTLDATAAAVEQVTFTVTGTSGAVTASGHAQVSVSSGGDFTIAVAPDSAAVARGQSVDFTVTTQAVGAPDSVALSVTGLPSGVTAAFNPATITAGDSATLTLTASSTAAAGAATFTVTGTGGTMGHTATGHLSVLAPPHVSLSTPGSTLSGIETLTAVVSFDPNTTLGSVVFYDGATSLGTSTSSPAVLTWDTRAATDGTHVLTAKITDGAGQSAVSPADTVQIENSVATTGASAAITAPAEGATISAVTTVTATATPSSGATITSVTILLDGVELGVSQSSPAAAQLEPSRFGNGAHALTARVQDSAGKDVTSAAVHVSVRNASATPMGGCATAAVDVLALLGLVALRRRRS